MYWNWNGPIDRGFVVFVIVIDSIMCFIYGVTYGMLM